MVLESARVEEDSGTLFRTILADAASESIFTVGFGEQSIKGFIEELDALEEPPTVRLLAANSVLKWLREDFLGASTAAELVADGTLALRVLSDSTKNTLLITDKQVLSVIHNDTQTACTPIEDTSFVTNTREQATEAWEAAEEFSLRTPPRSRVRETLVERIGPEVDTEFTAILDALGTTRNGEFDQVVAALLAAAKHGVQLYEIGNWGEDVGLASRATFSRKKNILEERGLIDTERIPMDVGRPRLRLLLDAERFSGTDTNPDDLVRVGQQQLSAIV